MKTKYEKSMAQQLMLNGFSIEEVSSELNMSKSTIRSWSKEPKFQQKQRKHNSYVLRMRIFNSICLLLFLIFSFLLIFSTSPQQIEPVEDKHTLHYVLKTIYSK